MKINSNISVIVPVYNAGNYLEKCVNSIANQTLKNIEIILVNDGSEDGSGKLCDYFAKQDERIKVIHQMNAGATIARKRGLENANSKYVCFIDCDDWIEENYLEYALETMNAENADMILFDHYVDDEFSSIYFKNGIEEGIYDIFKIQSKILPNLISTNDFFKWNIYPSLCNRILKRDLIYEIQKRVDSTIVMGEDAAVSVPYLAKCNKIVVERKAFYHYYQHMDSTVRRIQKQSDYVQYKLLYNTLFEGLKDCIDKKNLEQQLKKYILYIAGPRVMRLSNSYVNKENLFPFDDVRKNSRVIIYGMGIFGLNMYEFLENSNYCQIIAAFDKNASHFEGQKYCVLEPKKLVEIPKDEYDFIIITAMDENVQKIVVEYIQKLGISDNKIKKINMKKFYKWIDNELLV